MTSKRDFIPIGIAVLTVSDSRTLDNDTSGQLLCQRLQDAGHHLQARTLVPDDMYRIRHVISGWIIDPAVNAVLITGGTGLTGRDGTPEAIKVLFDKTIEGFGELFRMLSYEEIDTSTMQSRCIAGVANGTYLFALPGSSGACRTAWDRILCHQFNYQHRPCNLVELMPRLLER